ncbi:AMP-binding protein [Ornithinimicrobium tianjinense]|uniref:AMP-dependent synthetase n=1 Tax=Ornithinimicrobium tianjinense TaxID=1195761 RepID=A0A917BXL6_9MICO|nr:AMP-binding protein [Ornithinimicrobium tianjinense]GGF60219.1 AMP-dependent synthetase [Ornithinimicrobium tianjinense]
MSTPVLSASVAPRTGARRSPLPPVGSVDPGAPALLAPAGEVVDHGTLRARVEDLAAGLPDATTGRRLVHVPLRATVEDVVGYLAVLEAGHVALVTADGPSGQRVAGHWAPDLVVQDGEVRPGDGSADACARHTGNGPRHLLHPDLALLLSTSGSTGSPKLVRLSHANVTSNAAAIAAALGLTDADRGVTSLPLHYCFGLSVLHSHLTVGASVALTDASVLDDAFWATVDGQGVTDIAVVPHMVELMETTGALERPHPSLRLLTQAGGRMATDRIVRTAALGAEHGWGLSVMYGQTEATARIAVHAPADVPAAPDAVGRPVPGTEVVLDATVPEADPATGAGEVVVRGPGVMLGYAEHPDDLALGRMITELRTGDLGRLDEHGVLRIVGRRSGFVKVLGLRIDLARVERALEGEGLVACVTGDDEGLRVAVEPRAGTPTTDLSGMARRAAAHASGLGVGHVRVAVLPLARLANGKVDRAGCDALVRGSDPDECVDARQQLDAPTLEVRVGAALAEVLGLDEIGVDVDRSFVDQGGDSLSHVQASVRLTALLGELPRDWHHRPLRELVESPAPTLAAPAKESWLRRRLGAPVRLETSVVLRAIAVITICGTHAGLFRILGGAHTLLIVAGFNAALFALSAPGVAARWRGTARVLVGIAVPTVVMALLGLTYGRYGWDNVFLANWLVGDIAYGKHNELWFVDALVASTLFVTATLSVPAVARRWRVDPWPVAFTLVLLALVPRFAILHLFEGVLRGMMPTVLWLFAIGLALATARTAARRRWTMAAMVAGIATFFPDDPVRNLTILAGAAVLAFVPTVAVPSRLVPVVATLGAASLHIYLVQFHVLDVVPFPPLATVAAIAAGVLVWRLTDAPVRRLQQLVTRDPSRARVARARHTLDPAPAPERTPA